jgi:hypothetical protein
MDLRPLLDAPALLGVDVEGLDPLTPRLAELRVQGVYVGGGRDTCHQSGAETITRVRLL